jgi:uncharacterized protein (DUF1499 family)
MSFRWLTRNWAETSSPGDPPPLELSLPAGDALALVQRVVGGLPRWRIESVDPAAATLHATRRTRLWGFVDDVAVRLEAVPGEPARSRVHVRSKSRVGAADFGENRRNILELFAALTREQPS